MTNILCSTRQVLVATSCHGRVEAPSWVHEKMPCVLKCFQPSFRLLEQRWLSKRQSKMTKCASANLFSLNRCWNRCFHWPPWSSKDGHPNGHQCTLSWGAVFVVGPASFRLCPCLRARGLQKWCLWVLPGRSCEGCTSELSKRWGTFGLERMESTKQACNILQHVSQFFLLLAIVITCYHYPWRDETDSQCPNGSTWIQMGHWHCWLHRSADPGFNCNSPWATWCGAAALDLAGQPRWQALVSMALR